MRRTKIIATFGPAVDDPDVLAQLIEAGADVIRLNFSHGNWHEYERQIGMIREVNEDRAQERPDQHRHHEGDPDRLQGDHNSKSDQHQKQVFQESSWQAQS